MLRNVYEYVQVYVSYVRKLIEVKAKYYHYLVTSGS